MLLSAAIAVFLIVMLVRSQDLATRIVLLIPIAVGFGIPAFYLRKARTEARARAAGIRARVKVIDASESFGGVSTVNNQPLLRVDLELEVPGKAPRRLRKHLVVPRLAVPDVAAGATFDALIDPEHPDRFVIDW